ncbi:phage protease [Mameliella alba]|uniref:Mu-like prophage I protein n=1 Tax=Mameliella alba TaxID=561184 RepID=A0A0B3RY54_9RHOB|nr:phage protease [Mameliella alba]KHQ53002.1 Mu-like prophage I protein [Mameliella alba]
MSATVTVHCETALTGAPDWVQLVPLGEVKARDGRRFVNDDPARVLALFDAAKIDLVIDYEHQADRPEATRSGPVPAAGWIKELAARDTGIWGRVEWTDRARQMIAAREYRFLSPSLLAEKGTGRVVGLKGAGLVHRPALHMTALASQETDMPDMPDATGFMARLAQLLKLENGASEDDILAALEKRLGGDPDPREFVPVKAWEEAATWYNTELAAMRDERLAAKVEQAIAGGYILPAAKDWALSLCRADEASFDSFIQSTQPPWGHLSKRVVPGGPPPAPNGARPGEHSAEVLLLSEQLGIAPERLAEG